MATPCTNSLMIYDLHWEGVWGHKREGGEG